MTTAIAPARITEEEFLQMDHSGFELVDGHLEENPMSWETAWIGGEIYGQIRDFLKSHRLGTVFPQETGFAGWPGSPGKIRKPDVMFVRSGRIRGVGSGFLQVAPDLAVEVVSPNDRAEALERKLADYREAGVPLVWVIYPATRTVYIYREDDRPQILDERTLLDGESVLPGFTLDLAELFAMAAGIA